MHIVIHKSDHKLILYKGEQVLRTYKIAIGKEPEGNKVRVGDNRTPEGVYRIDWRNKKSGYHRALHISYPNSEDAERAKKSGSDPGGDIMIHGIKNGFGWLGGLHRLVDWTQGCIALTNSEMNELWELVPDGTPVEIKR